MPVDQVIQFARSQIGTPWGHLGRTPGKSLDCVGLVYLSAKYGGFNVVDLISYSRYPDGVLLVKELRLQLDEVSESKAGDILVMGFGRNRLPQHVGIQSDKGFIHSWQSVGKVVEHCLDHHWYHRIVHKFRLRS